MFIDAIRSGVGMRSTAPKAAGLLLVSAMLFGCSRSQKSEVAGTPADRDLEPERYSAQVVQTVTDGDEQLTTETRIVHNGALAREEWTENGERRALIWRPDLGKVFCLSLDREIYTESLPDSAFDNQTTQLSSPGGSEEKGRAAPDAEAIDQALAGAADPDSIEEEAKQDAKVGNYTCRVTEQRMMFADGHREVTRTYRAVELGGLAVRIEKEGSGQRGPVRVVTELRNVTLNVVDQEFDVPGHFKRVERL